MLARLERLGARGEVASKDASRIVLRVQETTTIEAVTAALRPLRFGVHQLETFPATAELPSGVQPPTPSRIGVRGACDVIEPWAASAGPGCHAAVEHVDAGECAAHCLVDPPVLARAQVREASLEDDPYAGPVLRLRLTDEGAARFAAFTSAHVGEHAAMVVDDVVLSAPVIQSAITGGALSLNGADPSWAPLLAIDDDISPWQLLEAR
ncbi:MAG: hypothetical protein R3B99_33135 [Polyangiales bacterium]